MTKNVGKTDRNLRFVLGILLIAAGIFFQVQNGVLWWLVIPGAVALGTALSRFCLLYVPFRISTLSKK